MPKKDDLNLDNLAAQFSDIAATPQAPVAPTSTAVPQVTPAGRLVEPRRDDNTQGSAQPVSSELVRGAVAPRLAARRVAEAPARMQGVYLYPSDLKRATDMEFRLRRMDLPIAGRRGPSLLVRAGLALLYEQFDRDPSATVTLVKRIADQKG